ncbi:hypothetical protein PAPYR_6936 [Paratrimastix pyriformis]|uniref:Uncharacterized protein n=1 Tax=Paratrimastix pyriformis TaxID=342808 RepID=A0ABQ8ULC8_9EUKA|nr:hypothetical protein PAPYR_6936 [Paratrimastix pyriformis]
MNIFVLSCRDPWATLIMNGKKTGETRLQSFMTQCRPGQTIAIHLAYNNPEEKEATQMLISSGVEEEYCTKPQAMIDFRDPGSGVMGCAGCIIGLVDVVETLHFTNPSAEEVIAWQAKALCDVTGRWVTRLANPRWLRRPIPMRGAPALWSCTLPLDCLPPPS